MAEHSTTSLSWGRSANADTWFVTPLSTPQRRNTKLVWTAAWPRRNPATSDNQFPEFLATPKTPSSLLAKVSIETSVEGSVLDNEVVEQRRQTASRPVGGGPKAHHPLAERRFAAVAPPPHCPGLSPSPRFRGKPWRANQGGVTGCEESRKQVFRSRRVSSWPSRRPNKPRVRVCLATPGERGCVACSYSRHDRFLRKGVRRDDVGSYAVSRPKIGV